MPQAAKRLFPELVLLFLPVFIIIGFWSSAYAHSAYHDTPHPLRVKPDLTHQSLTPHLHYFVDSTGLSDISDVASHPEWFSSLPERPGDPSFGFSRDAYWFMFRVKNSGATPVDWILELNYPLIDSFQLYIPDNGAYRSVEGGDRLLFNQREVLYRTFAFPLTELPGERTYFLRIQSKGGLIVPLIAWSPASFNQKKDRETLALGLSYGILFAMIFYHFYLFLAFRESSYLYLTFFILFACLFSMVNTGIAYQYLWPASPTWGNIAFPLFLASGILSALLFTRVLLDLKSRFPRLNLLFIGIIIISVSLIPFSLVVEYYHMARATSLLTVISGTLLIAAGIISLVYGYREARYYLLACAIFLVTAIVTAVRGFGFLPENFVTAWFNQIGMMPLALFFSFGVASKMEALKTLASTDHLTGLFNRRAFMEKMDLEIERCKRYDVPAVVMMMDLDHFKKINDTFGHISGDMILCRFAELIRDTLRTTDIFGRLGGDEFAVLLPETTLDKAMILAKRILHRSREYTVTTDAGDIRVTISIGAAQLSAEDTRKDHLLDRADDALYTAKKNGRERVEVNFGVGPKQAVVI